MPGLPAAVRTPTLLLPRLKVRTRLHHRRRQVERELEGIFNLSLDLLCITDEDGFFKRLNPAFERILGYTSEELLSRPYFDFIHPDDRTGTRHAQDRLIQGEEVALFENRYIRADGGVRWLQWNAHSEPEEGLIYAAARDVTESRQAGQEQAALRRVATLVAKGAPPEMVFDAVVAEMRMLLSAHNTRLMRYEPGDMVTVVAAGCDPQADIPQESRYSLEGENVSAVVRRTGRPARLDSFSGPPGSIADNLRRLGITSAAGAPVIVEGRLWGVMVAAWRQHQLAAGIEDRIAQFTELVAAAISNAQARTDLAASRARVVAASDETRRRIERDLHDGAQQRMVSLGLGLRMVQAAVPPGHAELEKELARLADGMVGALEELRELSRGIHPAILSAGGLRPALNMLARRCAVPVELDVDVRFRLPEQVEVAAYYVASEALANSAKHAHASIARIRIEMQDGVLKEQIYDDGIGGADPSRGTGLTGLADRVEALGGRITVSSNPEAGTRIQAEFPVGESQAQERDKGRRRQRGAS